ncbi:MAG: MerC domain-containing protein [Bacteroidota bacterium]|jgi:hypothetical protein
MSFKINWHTLGISASIICAIHCALAPLLISTLPLFGVNIIENLWFELILLLVAFLIGVITLWHGYRKHHQKKGPLLLFSFGMICFILHQFYESDDGILLLIIPGVIAIITAHLLNYHYCRVLQSCSTCK